MGSRKNTYNLKEIVSVKNARFLLNQEYCHFKNLFWDKDEFNECGEKSALPKGTPCPPAWCQPAGCS